MNELDRRAAQREIQRRLDETSRAPQQVPGFFWPRPTRATSFDKFEDRWPNLVVDANSPMRAFLATTRAQRQRIYTETYNGREKQTQFARPHTRRKLPVEA